LHFSWQSQACFVVLQICFESSLLARIADQNKIAFNPLHQKKIGPELSCSSQKWEKMDMEANFSPAIFRVPD